MPSVVKSTGMPRRVSSMNQRRVSLMARVWADGGQASGSLGPARPTPLCCSSILAMPSFQIWFFQPGVGRGSVRTRPKP